jgi:hypothetical protein
VPEQANLRFTRARIYRQLNKREQAWDDLQVALAHAPNETFRWQLRQWQKQIEHWHRKSSANTSEAALPAARPELTMPQLLVGGLAFIPILGFPFALVSLLWGLLCWKKNGAKLVSLGLAGPILSLIVLFGFVRIITSIFFGEIPSESTRLQTALTETAAMIEAVKRNTGTYPESLQALADSPNYWQSFDYTQPQKIASGKSIQPNYYYQRVGNPPGYYLFAVGLDGKPFTADDVRLESPSAFPGLRQPPKG